MSEVKGIDTTDKQMRWFPLMDGLLEVDVGTKKRQAYIKVAVPNELANLLMEQWAQGESDMEYILIGYRLKDK